MKTPVYLSQFEHQLSKNGSLASHVFRFAMIILSLSLRCILGDCFLHVFSSTQR